MLFYIVLHSIEIIALAIVTSLVGGKGLILTATNHHNVTGLLYYRIKSYRRVLSPRVK